MIRSSCPILSTISLGFIQSWILPGNGLTFQSISALSSDNTFIPPFHIFKIPLSISCPSQLALHLAIHTLWLLYELGTSHCLRRFFLFPLLCSSKTRERSFVLAIFFLIFVFVCDSCWHSTYLGYLPPGETFESQPCLRSFSQDQCCHHSGTHSHRQTMSIRGVAVFRLTEFRCVTRRPMLKHTTSMAWSLATRTQWHYHQLSRQPFLPPWCRHNHSTTFTEIRRLVNNLLATRGGKRRLSTPSTFGQPSVSTAIGRHIKILKRTKVVYGADPSWKMLSSTVSLSLSLSLYFHLRTSLSNILIYPSCPPLTRRSSNGTELR